MSQIRFFLTEYIWNNSRFVYLFEANTLIWISDLFLVLGVFIGFVTKVAGLWMLFLSIVDRHVEKKAAAKKVRDLQEYTDKKRNKLK